MEIFPNLVGLLLAFLPLMFIVVYLWFDGNRSTSLGLLVTVIVVIGTVIIAFYPIADLSMLSFPNGESDVMGMPSGYFGDYIHINGTQKKTITYHFNITNNATLQYQTFTLYGIETYDFNQSDMKFYKSYHNLAPVTFSMTITKENFSHTIYPSWNTSNTYDFSGIPGFFPIVNNDTINFTYYMDTHNLSSEFNQTVFLFPFKPHTEQLGNAILTVKTPEDIFPGFFSYILISCSITCSVLSCAYLYFRNRQQERQRERNNEHWRLYNQIQAREALYESMQQISEAHNQEPLPSNTHLPEKYADYHYAKQTPRENLQQNIDYYRDQGYWTKIINISPKTSIIYVSNWRQDQVGERGIPEWRRPRRRQQN